MCKKWIKYFGLLMIVVLICGNVKAEDAKNYDQIKKERLEEFNQQKFGMFIHFGIYSGNLGEVKGYTGHLFSVMSRACMTSAEYEKFASEFNPVKFDAAKCVALAKAAGMKYIVFTTKHHEGFCLFDSKFTDYDIMDTSPLKRDLVKELADECKKAGITFGVYYSHVDWHHPDFSAKYSHIREQCPDGFHGIPNNKGDMDAYAVYMKNQLRELLTNYGEIGIMWFDDGGAFRNYDINKLLHGEELIEMIHKLQPRCLINDRLRFGGDYGISEQKIPGVKSGPFEVCMTMNGDWGYNKFDNNWKDANTIVRNLLDIASKGGNYLLNIGPDGEGVIPEQSVQALTEVGKWLAVNGEAVYGTQARPSVPNIRLFSGSITAKPGKLFLNIFDWPKKRKIFVEGLNGSAVKKAYLLADAEQKPLSFEPHERCVLIDVPQNPPSKYVSVIVVEYDQNKISD